MKTSGDVNGDPLFYFFDVGLGTGGTEQTACKHTREQCVLVPVCAQ